MERTVGQRYLQVLHRIATKNTILHGVLETFLYRRDKFLRNVSALHLVDELEVALLVVFVLRTNGNDNVGKLTTTTTLFLVNFAKCNVLGDGLFVVNLGLTLVTFHLKFAFQAVDDDVQVQLTHTRDNGLTTLLVGTNGKRGVFFGQLSQSVVKLGNVCLALRLNGDRNNRIGEGHRFQHDGCVLVAKRVACANIFEAYTCANITSVDAFHRDFLVRVHLEQAADTLFLTRTSIVNIRAGLYLTRINAEEHQTAHEGVGGNLKRQSRCGSVFRRLTLFLFVGVGVNTYDSYCIQW